MLTLLLIACNPLATRLSGAVIPQKPYFIVNGQVCTSGHCVLDSRNAQWPNPLTIALGGRWPKNRTVELAIASTKCDGTCPTRMHYPSLEMEDQRIWPGAGTLQFPFRHATPNHGKSIHLHLEPALYPRENQTITLTLSDPHDGALITDVSIHIRGERIPWYSANITGPTLPEATLWQSGVRIAPAHDRTNGWNIDLTAISPTKEVTVTIFNTIGKEMSQYRTVAGQRTALPTSDLEDGIYFVRVEMEGQHLTTQRLIITRGPQLPKKN